MNRHRFGHIALSVSALLTALLVVQALSLYGIYGDRRAEFARRVTQAMTRAAYDDLLFGNASVPSGRLSFSKSANVDSVRIDLFDTILHRELEGADTSLSLAPKNDTLRYNVDILEAGGVVRHLRQEILLPSLNILRLNLSRYDSLLTRNLLEEGIDLPHRVDVVRGGTDSAALRIVGGEIGSGGVVVPALNDTLRIADPRTFTCPLTTKNDLLFRLRIENPDRKLLRDMAGIILSSLLMLAAVSAAMLFLLRTLFRSKTLEEMRIDLTRNITHELRTPIAVANAVNDALLDFGAANDPARRTRYLCVIREQLADLDALVQRILAMSIEEREEFPLRRERFAVGALLEETAAKFRTREPQRAEITVEVAPADLTVSADRFHLAHALDNLVDNALKYSRDRVAVRLSASRGAGCVVLRVADDGIGIDRKAQAHLFEKFYRVPTGDRHDVRGFGLGLYFVRLIAVRHGGTITVDSRPGCGATFTLTIPDNEL